MPEETQDALATIIADWARTHKADPQAFLAKWKEAADDNVTAREALAEWLLEESRKPEKP